MRPSDASILKNRRGMSLVETMVAMALFAILIVGFVEATVSQRKSMNQIEVQDLKNRMFYKTVQSLLETQVLMDSAQWMESGDRMNDELYRCLVREETDPRSDCISHTGDGSAIDYPLYLAFPPVDSSSPWGRLSGGGQGSAHRVLYNIKGNACPANSVFGVSCPVEVVTRFRAWCRDRTADCTHARVIAITVTVIARVGGESGTNTQQVSTSFELPWRVN